LTCERRLLVRANKPPGSKEGHQVSAQSRVPRLITAGVIADQLGQPLHRVLHVLGTRQHIRPSARAGTLRLYDRKAVAMVRYELNSIDARRCRKAEADVG
jgi:hypothetical protein